MSGFKLAPSRLNRPQAAAVDSTARTTFTGLTASKLGLLAESKLTPSTGAIQAKTANGAGGAEAKEEVTAPTLPTTFSFTPLSKPKDDSEDKSDDKSDGTKGKSEKKLAQPVFGENLFEKVTALPPATTEAGKDTEGEVVTKEKDLFRDLPKDSPEKKDFVASSLLFSNAASKASDDESEKKTLSESAAEYTESHANKRKYDVVDVVTGEEAESNVLGSQVKLFIFDKDKRNWIERGRGMLRLNDSPVSTPGHLKSRLVMRTSGNMRVVLNTKLWPDMICEKANEKNVRISALDEGEVKIFLIACSIKEAEKLFTALEYRINQLNTNKEAGVEDEDDEEEEKERQAKRQGEGEPPEKRPAPSTEH